VKRIVTISIAAAVAVATAGGTIAFYAADTQTTSCGAAPEVLAAFETADSIGGDGAVRFIDGAGNTRTLADYRGQGVVLNFWATWCPPCVREMPSLDRLRTTLGADDIAVLAVSGDRGGAPVVESFYKEHDIKNLPVLVDDGLRSARARKIAGLPTTLIIDREGRELGRLAGAAEWDAPEAVSFIRSCIDGKNHESPSTGGESK
jgi:thiol-disulfide isomerase/thioredoxin